jgi:hypothetical protein
VYRPLASSLVAAFVALVLASPSAASVPSEDVPVPGGTTAFAQAFGIDPVPDRSRFLSEMIRLLYNAPEGRRPAAEAYLQSLRQALLRDRTVGLRTDRDARGATDRRAANELVPIPLSVDVWSTILHRRLSPSEAVTVLVADRGAALICLGLSGLDDQTLQFFADHPSLLERVYERSAAPFGAFGGGLEVHNNRVVPAGAAADRDDVTSLWEAVVVEKTTRAERFITQLMELNEGRVAYLYDVIARLDHPHRAFALGLWIQNASARLERFKSLAGSVGAFREAHLKTLPYGRASYDLSMALMRIQVDRDGTPKAPASRTFWSRVFAGSDLPSAGAARSDSAADDDPIDAAWLSDAIGSADVRLRGERLDQIGFAQRVFGDAPADQRANVFVAIRALTHFRMLIWTLDRIGIRSPQIYATAARRAARLSPLDGRRGFEAHAQFQGALAVVARMTTVKTITTPRAQTLVEQLVALPITDDGRFAGAVARWMRDEIVGASKADSMEAAVLAAMSGAASGEGAARRLTWEGQPYRLDLGGAERKRLEHVRERQEGVPLDVPLQLAADARALATATADAAQEIVGRLTAALDNIPRRVGHESTTVNPAGVAPAPNSRDALRKAIDEVAREVRNRDGKRVARAAEPIAEIVDTLMAQALLSIAYAADVGDPEGTVLLADDVSQRHDFGLGGKDTEGRLRVTWMVPRADVSPGVPWHVTGSLLGLDVGLGTLALRRLNFERVLEAPKLTSNERDAFAISIALLNPFELTDDDRDAISDAMARGRRRVGALAAGDPATFDQVADDLGMEGVRRRAVRWALAHDREHVASLFSATELLTLGGGDVARLNPWGMSMVVAEGCLCSRLTPPGRWPTLLGRPPLGLTASAVADLNLHIATMLRELRLPAPIAKVVLSGAMQDFIDEVKPTDDSDWLTLARAARSVTRERIEDYVAAATAAGPLVPDTGAPDEHRR